MSLRFRKSVKIMPGIKMNISKSGVGFSAGVNGARVSVSPKGKVTRTIGIPGTGIYDVETISKKPVEKKAPVPSAPPLPPEKRYTPTQLKTFSIVFLVLSILLFLMGLFMLPASVPFGIVCIGVGIFTFVLSRKYKKISQ